MKITEYLLLAAVMIPTILLIVAVVVSLVPVAPEPQPAAQSARVSSAGLYPADPAEEVDSRL
jgi:hypothetical protein